MSSLAYSGSYTNEDGNAKVWRAVIISLVLHAVVVAVYPHLSQIELPKIPERMEIEFFTVKPSAPAENTRAVTPQIDTPEPPKVTPVPQQPVTKTETPKPVLASPNNDADYRVKEESQPQPVKQEAAPPVTAPAPVTTNNTSSNESTHQTANEEHAKEARPATNNNTPVSSESDELTASDNDAWGDYGDQLRALVGKSKQYPAIAIRRHLEGDVTVVAQFTRGELISVSLAESSKHAPLDEEALRMVKKAIAQLGVKESLKKKTFRITIPVSFRLE